ncbi:MAG: recQ, partial [Bacillota bacterium]|nr:recQ [Bacillota bacterium]
QTANHLLVTGYLHLTPDQYPVLKVTNQGMEFLEANQAEPILLKLPKKQEEAPAAKKKTTKGGSGAEATYPELFELLRKRRYEIAQKEHKPPYIIFSDKALKEMSTYLPVTAQSMLNINGVGSSKLEKYGSEFMGLIKEYMNEHKINR